MGSSEFAVPTLLKLIEDPQLEVSQIYTKPPKPKGRGLQTSMTPIHSIACERGLLVKTPSSLREEQLPDCDITVVVAYGLILPNNILAHPSLTSLNIHPSLLPRWRGPSPMQYTILEGDSEAGVSIIQVTPELDAGAIYAQKAIPLSGKETYSDLHDQLADLGASMLHDVVRNINKSKPKPQEDSKATYSKKLPNSVEIDFDEGVEFFFRKLRVFGSIFTNIDGKPLKIIEVSEVSDVPSREVGLTVEWGSKELSLQFKDGRVVVKTVQPINKKQMSARDFVNGIGNQRIATKIPKP